MIWGACARRERMTLTSALPHLVILSKAKNLESRPTESQRVVSRAALAGGCFAIKRAMVGQAFRLLRCAGMMESGDTACRAFADMKGGCLVATWDIGWAGFQMLRFAQHDRLAWRAAAMSLLMVRPPSPAHRRKSILKDERRHCRRPPRV